MKKTVLSLVAFAAAGAAQADPVTDWNTVAGDLLVQAKMGTPPAVRVMAIVAVTRVAQSPRDAGVLDAAP